jgi:hypothetical protein
MGADKTLVDGAYGVAKRQKVDGISIDPKKGEELASVLAKREADKDYRDRAAKQLGKAGEEMEADYFAKYGDDDPEEEEEVLETTYDTWKKENPTGNLDQWRKLTEKPLTKSNGFTPVSNVVDNSTQQSELELEQKEEAKKKLAEEVKMAEATKMYNEASDSPGVDAFYETAEGIVKETKKDIEPGKLKTLGIKALNNISIGVQQFKALKKRILDLNKGRRDGTGYSEGMSVEDNSRYARIVSAKVPLTSRSQNGKVELGFKENGKFTSMGDLSRDVEKNTVDNKSKASIIDMKRAQIKIATNSKPGDEFKREETRGLVSDIVKAGNLKSLVNDKMFGRTSFATDLLDSNLKGMTYGELGIDSAYDLDGDGVLSANDKLSKRDQKKIMKELLSNPSNEEMLRETVTDYLTSHLEENYYKVYNSKHPTAEVSPPVTVGTSKSAADYLV